MRIKKIQIKNFKSLVDFELEDLKPFCAFVGPNASGKSNIFEALEFLNYVAKYTFEAPSFFGGKNSIFSYNPEPVDGFMGKRDILFEVTFEDEVQIYFDALFSSNGTDRFESIGNIGNQLNNYPVNYIYDLKQRKSFLEQWQKIGNKYDDDLEVFIDSFSRIFVGKSDLNRPPFIERKLSNDASNLSNILGKVFEKQDTRSDFIEWVKILIPELKNIEVKKSNIDGTYQFSVFENSSGRPFPVTLLSDGTKNILALMAAVYQTDQPQFLCLEEPENGLHPQAIQLLVDFFREKCEEKGHHIWLNTHSQTLVRCLEIDELILVNKINGETRAKQMAKEDNIDLKTDEAWLSNALGGGILWSK